MKTVLTIAGSDCSGGAGIQADIKTMTMHGVYAMSAITALTAQNTCGVAAVAATTPDFLAQQLDCIFTDIMPDAVKIGMLCNRELLGVVVEKLRQYHACNIVVDPVMVSTSGRVLLQQDAIAAMQAELFPLATLITPNMPEAAVLSGMDVQQEQNMEAASQYLQQRFGCAVLCKGGHATDTANDLLYTSEGMQWFAGQRIANANTHGTGCTLSSAIASNLAKGEALQTAVANAKQYLAQAIAAQLNLGVGNGPLAHNYSL